MVASTDLHGLGATDGPPATYTWTPPSLLPHVLPWLAVLVLLMLKPNRTGRAWWIWLPLACIAALDAASRSALDFIPSEPLDIFCQVFNSLAFGIAAVWLLATWLQERHRFLVFLKMLVTAAGFSALAFLVRQDSGEGPVVLAFLVFVGVCVLVTVAALSLTGLVCRPRYLPLRLSILSVVFTVALWAILSAPFAIFALAAGGGGPWLELVTIVLALAAVTFVTVLPFLILSFTNPFYRERLKGLLHLEPTVQPPLNIPLPAAGQAA